MMIYAIHAPIGDRLEEIKSEMLVLGAPTIRVVDCCDFYQALEGSHRIAAAHALGLTPKLVIFGQDDEIDITTYDWFDPANWHDTVYPAGEVAGELFSSTQARDYAFDE